MKKYVYFIIFVALIIGLVYSIKKESDKRKEASEQYEEWLRKSEEAVKRTNAAAEIHLNTGSPIEPVVLDIDEDGNIRH